MPSNDDTHPPAREGIPTERRFELLERDVRAQARSLSAFVAAGKSFTIEQMEQLRTVFREELADAGLRIDGPDHIDDAREDFRFLRRLRENWDGATKKVGSSVLYGLLGIAAIVISLGFWAWLRGGIK